MNAVFYAGTYSYPVLWGDGSLYQGNGVGVSRLFWNGEDGAFTVDEVFAGVQNPSYIVTNAARTRLYCVNELDDYDGQAGGSVSAYDITRGFALLNRLPTGGESPCHAALSADERFLCVSNYNGGSLRVFPLAADGSLSEACPIIQHTGHGADPLRQAKPHVHSVTFSGQYAIAVDLGTDQLSFYPVAGDRLSSRTDTLALPEGAGPRMLKYHPSLPVCYCVCELNNELAVFQCDANGLPTAILQRISTVGNSSTPSAAGDVVIAPDGQTLYVSNRGQDTIAAFRLAADGSAALLTTVPCGGKTPRFLALSPDGNWLFACNQDSDTVGIFCLKDGWPQRHGSFALPTPTCLCLG